MLVVGATHLLSAEGGGGTDHGEGEHGTEHGWEREGGIVRVLWRRNVTPAP